MDIFAKPRMLVLGAGAFGTALAITFHEKFQVTLKTRNSAQTNAMNVDRLNQRYLPDIKIPLSMRITDDMQQLNDPDIMVVATPTQHTPTLLTAIMPFIRPECPVILTSKGILQDHPHPFLYQWMQEQYPHHATYVLSGPNFAHDLVSLNPSVMAATLAGGDFETTLHLCQNLHIPHYRLYPSVDRLGVSFLGAIKNVYAIAAGIAMGLGFNDSSRAALLTRALAETKRLAVQMGALPETLMGLCGVGDLMLSCNSRASRNVMVGIELANDVSLAAILATKHTIAEGVYTAKALHDMNQHYNVRMPIAQAVYEILYQEVPVNVAIDHLIHNPITHSEYA